LAVLRQWAQAATGQGAALWAQFNHPGKQSTKGLNAYNLAPSAVPFREDMAAFFETPREATPSEIQDIIERFGRSAAICKKAGFSGVEIHGAHDRDPRVPAGIHTAAARHAGELQRTAVQGRRFRGGYRAGEWPELWEEFTCDWRELWFDRSIEPPSWVLADEALAAGAKGILFGSTVTPGGSNLVVYTERLDAQDRLEVHDPTGALPKNQDSWR